MAKVSVLVDTDVFIDYLNNGRFSSVFDSSHFSVYYSIVTRKELLTKLGLRETEREAIVAELSRCRLINLSDAITARYSNLRRQNPSLNKADALIAATVLVKRLPLVTRNKRHLRIVEDLPLFGEQFERTRITGACRVYAETDRALHPNESKLLASTLPVERGPA